MINRHAVNEIRPDDIEPLMAEALAKDNAWIESQRHLFVPGFCPVCGPEAESVLFCKLDNGLEYKRCVNCDTLFLNTHPDKSGYEYYFRNSSKFAVFAKYIYPASKEARLSNIYVPRLHRMLDYFKKNSSRSAQDTVYLEVGPGSGDFARLVNASENFTRCVVIEHNPFNAQLCRDNKLEVIESPVEDVNLGKEFDNVGIVACFEVLALIYDPANFLKSIYNIMPSGSLLCITTPNGMGADILELKARSTNLDINHIQLFNPQSLTQLLENTGFRILELDTPGSLDVDLMERGFNEFKNSSSNSWLEHFILNADAEKKDNLQKFLVDNKQSSHMWIIAQKP